MLKLRKLIIRRRAEQENGSDVITTLFMVPFIIGLIFVLIDVSTYFQTRSTVQNIARDGARSAALYGGVAQNIPLNTTGRSVTQSTFDRLWDGSNCIPSNCSQTPVVTCGPNRATSLADEAYCRVTYRYTSAGGGLVEWLGFGDILAFPINVSETFRVETRY